MSIHIQSRHVQSGHSRSRIRAGSIELRRISNSEWRVSDTSIPDGDAGCVLGFVEYVDGPRYDVLRLGHGHGIDRMSFSELDDVVTYFARLS